MCFVSCVASSSTPPRLVALTSRFVLANLSSPNSHSNSFPLSEMTRLNVLSFFRMFCRLFATGPAHFHPLLCARDLQLRRSVLGKFKHVSKSAQNATQHFPVNLTHCIFRISFYAVFVSAQHPQFCIRCESPFIF